MITQTPSSGSVDLSAPGPIGAGTPSTAAFLSLDVASGTITASNPVLDGSQTWNNSGVTFTGLKLNVTDTASAAGSLLMDLQKGGTSVFAVGKSGVVGFTVVSAPITLGTGTWLAFQSAGGISSQGDGLFDFWSNGYANSTKLCIPASNTLQLGANHATAAVDQTIKGPNTTTGVGGALSLMPGTGSVSGGSVSLKNSLGDPVVTVDGTGLGFFNVGPIAQPSATTAASTAHSVASGSDSVDLADLNQNLNNLGSALNEIRTLISSYGLSA